MPDLQAQIDAATPGSTLTVAPGDYAPIVVWKPLTIQSTGALPLRRVLASDDPGQFIRIAASGQPAIAITAPASLIGFKATRTDVAPPIVSLTGDWSTGTAVLDRVWVVGASVGNRRGIEANGWRTQILRSRVENIIDSNADAQAIANWTGPGPLTIDDCYAEGAAESVLVGGDDPVDQAHSPHDFVLRNSYLTKQLGWRSRPGTVKNTLELKNCIGFTVEDNIVENAWKDGQDGFLLLLTVRNQDGHAPYSNLTDGLVQRNRFRNGSSGVNILGTDDTNPSGRMRNVTLRNNRFEGIDPTVYGGDGRLVLILGGPQGLTLDHNTFVGANLNSFLSLGNYAPLLTDDGFVYSNNYAMEGYYGIAGDNTGVGLPSLQYYAPNAVWQNICLLRQAPDYIGYPPDTTYVPDEATALARGAGATGYPTG